MKSSKAHKHNAKGIERCNEPQHLVFTILEYKAFKFFGKPVYQ